MAILLSILAWLGAVLGAILLALLALPFHVRARGELSEERMAARLDGSWGWGLLGLRWRPGRSDPRLYLLGLRIYRIDVEQLRRDEDRRRARREKKERRRQDRRASKHKKRARRARDRARGRGQRGLRWFVSHRRTIYDVIARLLRTLRFRLHLRGTLGLDDPADTAQLFAVLQLMSRLPVELDIQANYLEEQIDLEGDSSARVWLGLVLLVALSLLLRRDVWRLLRKPRLREQRTMTAGSATTGS